VRGADVWPRTAVAGGTWRTNVDDGGAVVVGRAFVKSKRLRLCCRSMTTARATADVCAFTSKSAVSKPYVVVWALAVRT